MIAPLHQYVSPELQEEAIHFEAQANLQPLCVTVASASIPHITLLPQRFQYFSDHYLCHITTAGTRLICLELKATTARL